MKIITPLSSNNEFGDERPQSALLEITEGVWARIKQLQTAAHDLNVFMIEEFNSTPVFSNHLLDTEDGEDLKLEAASIQEKEVRMEYTTLNVSGMWFKFQGVPKGMSGSDEVSTPTIYIADLDITQEYLYISD